MKNTAALEVGMRIRNGESSAEILRPLDVSSPRFPGHLYVGLTGGIGAGKSTVAARWQQCGATVFSADQIAREVVEPGTSGLREIECAFGPQILQADGSLDRGALAAVVFEDPAARKLLESITHPLIGLRAKELVKSAPTRLVIYDVPLLVETGMRRLFDLAVVVDAPVDRRLKRLEGRGIPAPEARRRLKAQATHEQRLAVADIWIENNGTEAQTSAVAEQIYEDWLLSLS